MVGEILGRMGKDGRKKKYDWRDFTEDGKDGRKKLRENNFFECLVGVILGWKN